MVIKHDAHPLLLDKVSALFMGCAPSTLDMNSVYVCEYRRTGRHRFIGDTGLEVEDGNEVLDELEKEDEDGAAFVRWGYVRNWWWCRERWTGNSVSAMRKQGK